MIQSDGNETNNAKEPKHKYVKDQVYVVLTTDN